MKRKDIGRERTLEKKRKKEEKGGEREVVEDDSYIRQSYSIHFPEMLTVRYIYKTRKANR